ncbi:hypothetical protein ABE073_00465 [Lederbergia citrisecunda]|uniref:STM4504/CBY_0614 family protein n=1 Tax=Lederbergia citrisecunda TaxID=2833583 RepID=UPI003D2E2AA9
MSFHSFSVKMGFKVQHDVYEYERVNKRFRKQFCMILSNSFERNTLGEQYIWTELENHLKIELCREFLSNKNESFRNILAYFVETNDLEALYIINEVMGRLKGEYDKYLHWANIYKNDFQNVEYYHEEAIRMNSIIKKISQKLLENGIGYETIDGQLMKIENQFIHTHIIKDSIQLLQSHKFISVSEEFMQAHMHYKSGNNKDAIVNAAKAFESTMKVICSKLNYEFNSDRDTAGKLITILIDNDFIPTYLQDHLSGVQKSLGSGIPTVRNKIAHGEGENPIEISSSMVKYVLNLCATNIVFLINTYEEHVLKKEHDLQEITL